MEVIAFSIFLKMAPPQDVFLIDFFLSLVAIAYDIPECLFLHRSMMVVYLLIVASAFADFLKRYPLSPDSTFLFLSVPLRVPKVMRFKSNVFPEKLINKDDLTLFHCMGNPGFLFDTFVFHI